MGLALSLCVNCKYNPELLRVFFHKYIKSNLEKKKKNIVYSPGGETKVFDFV